MCSPTHFFVLCLHVYVLIYSFVCIYVCMYMYHLIILCSLITLPCSDMLSCSFYNLKINLIFFILLIFWNRDLSHSGCPWNCDPPVSIPQLLGLWVGMPGGSSISWKMSVILVLHMLAGNLIVCTFVGLMYCFCCLLFMTSFSLWHSLGFFFSSYINCLRLGTHSHNFLRNLSFSAWEHGRSSALLFKFVALSVWTARFQTFQKYLPLFPQKHS